MDPISVTMHTPSDMSAGLVDMQNSEPGNMLLACQQGWGLRISVSCTIGLGLRISVIAPACTAGDWG